MALTNCTISSLTITSNVNEPIGSNTGTMTITPDSGYVVSASNFTNNTSVKPEISAISLADSTSAGAVGNTVVVTIIFNSSFVMPAAGSAVEIDIDGSATDASETVSGTIDFNIRNCTASDVSGNIDGFTSATTSTFDVAYSATGSSATENTVVIATIKFIPDTNYEFDTSIRGEEEFNDTFGFSIEGSENYELALAFFTATLIQYQIKYQYPADNSSGHKITFNAHPNYKPTRTAKVRGFNLDTKDIDSAGAVREVNIFGDNGATFNIIATTGQPVNTYGSGSVGTGTVVLPITEYTIDSTGVVKIPVRVPGTTTDKTVAITLSGSDIDDSLVTHGINSIVSTISQVADVTLTISATGGTNVNAASSQTFTVTKPGGNVSTSGSNVSPPDKPNKVVQRTKEGTVGHAFTFVFTSAASDGQNIHIRKQPDDTFFTNLNSSGWDIGISSVAFSGDGTTSLVTTITGVIRAYGSASITSVFDRTAFLVSAGTAVITSSVDVAFGIAKTGFESPQAAAAHNFSLLSGRSATYDAVFAPHDSATHVYKLYTNDSGTPTSAQTNNYYYKYGALNTADVYIGKWTSGGIITERYLFEGGNMPAE